MSDTILFWVGMQYENVRCSYFGCGRNKLNVNFRLRSKISEGGNPKGRIARAKMLAALNYHIAAALVTVILKNFSVHFEALKHEKLAFAKVVKLAQQKSMFWIRRAVAVFEQLQSLAGECFTNRLRRNVVLYQVR